MTSDSLSNLPLNQTLKQKRLLLDLSLEEVSEKTNIKISYLQSLEQGNYHELPAEVYVQGYLKSLSRIYGLDLSEVLETYKQECGLLKYNNEASKLRPPISLKITPLLTPKAVSALLLLAVFITVSSYMGWQISQVTAAPELVVKSPLDGEVVTNGQIIVSGRTEPGSSLTINNQAVPLDDRGNFEQTIYLGLGENQIVVRSENRFEKTTQVIKRVVLGTPNPQVLGESEESTTQEDPLDNSSSEELQ